MQKNFKVKLKVLSPVHIGTGEEYIPTDYVIKDGYLKIFDREKFIDKLFKTKKYDEFLKICEKGDILEIRYFIFQNIDDSLILHKIEVTNEIIKKYTDTLNKPSQIEIKDKKKIINALEIRKHTYSTFGNNLIIPGSSIKGAIRTAILDKYAKEKKFKKEFLKDRNDRNLQKYLLGIKEKNNSDDPFRFIKVSDFKIEKASTIIDFIYNIKIFGSKNKKVPVKMEILEPGSIFEGTIQIMNNSPIKINEIIESCNNHYLDDTFNFEYKNFNYRASNLNLNDFKKSNNSFFLKIGQHSGAFAVTIDKYRNRNIWHQKLKKRMNHQTTIWKSNYFNMPLGWVKCEIITNKKNKPASEKDIEKLVKRFKK